ncbi:hypothetical protein [Halolamina salifodinae]|uniref:Uncharacterized protein n=1 Tax=Halolamina salifodinae TaxID=1202767 RepID=A0A8T4GXL4_9EURY|nr:hypothetical protein [Halolamina salifodinae]MBP1987767.1 hypothetical protein [Halolamina salifodinae]
MQVRDAVERDAPAMASLGDAPESVLRNLVHDRSVRVLVEEGGGADEEENDEVLGFVSFDAREDAVHVTEFGGDRAACERLLAEPLRFAEREAFPVEMLLRDADDEGSPTRTAGDDEGSPTRTAGDDAMREAVEAVGFTEAGPGPRFRGETTRRYRYEPS